VKGEFIMTATPAKASMLVLAMSRTGMVTVHDPLTLSTHRLNAVVYQFCL
jgi:hypothetical protein